MIDILTGSMNSGKTLGCTHYLLKDYNSGRDIICNYHLYFPPSKKGNKIFLINRDTLIQWAKEGKQLKNTTIGLDEFWILMDSRLSMSNTVISYFFNQSSKDDMRIRLTTQFIGQVDSRMRDNCHRITQCSRAIFKDGKFIDIDNELRFLSTELLKDLYIKLVCYKRINRGITTEIILDRVFYIKADRYFNLYDTTEKIIKQ